MGKLISNTSIIQELEQEAFATYVQAVEEFEREVQNRPYHYQLYQMIVQLIERKDKGDLKDNSDVPDKEEIEALLGIKPKGLFNNDTEYLRANKFAVYQMMIETYVANVEYYGVILVQKLEDQDFIAQLYADKNQIARKNKYLSYLTRSKAGLDYLKICAFYTPVSNTSVLAPIYSPTALEIDFRNLETALNNNDINLIDVFLNYHSLLIKILPHYNAIEDIELNKKTYYLCYLLLKSIIENSNDVFDTDYTDFEQLVIEEFENNISRINYKNIKINPVLYDKLFGLVNSVQLVFLSLKLGKQVNEIRSSAGNRGYVELMSTMASIIEVSNDLMKSEEFQKVMRNNVAFNQNLVKSVSVVNTFALSSVLACYDLHDLTHSTLQGDDRASWIAGMSALSNLSVPLMLIVGVTNPWVILLLPLGLQFISWAGQSFFDTEFANKLKTWLNSNYFGGNKDDDYEINVTNPLNVGFEWNSTKLQDKLILQIRSLYSLMYPLNSEYDEIAEATLPGFYHLTFRLNEPKILAGDFYLRLRFFEGRPNLGREVTNADINGYASYGGPWYLIPIAFNEPDFLPTGWQSANANNFFVKHQVEPKVGGTSDQGDFNELKTYEFTILLKGDRRMNHKFYQIQIIPAGKKINAATLLPQSKLQELVNLSPFIITETKMLNIF